MGKDYPEKTSFSWYLPSMQPTGTAKAEAQCLITPLPLTNLNPRAGKWAIFGPKSLLRVGVTNDVNVPYGTKHESIYLKKWIFSWSYSTHLS